mmetsp:Transcript_44517/g.117675  ORF Transcript_44517/g.117675 Transcript_44517/m.117675 type:complete len:292 (-) Transcript_44517:382-1257(-)
MLRVSLMPSATRSIAACRSSCMMLSAFRRTARIAASFTTFSSSAPLKPEAARATPSRSTLSESFRFAACTCRILLRPSSDGRLREIWRSKRPGLRRASSRLSTAFVAARTMTVPPVALKPSISVRIWLRVCSRSPLPEPPRPPLLRFLPMASISSMKTMQGALALALEKMSRTREAPTPTNLSTNSEADVVIIATPASPASARARSVLPVPGGPEISTPLGTRAPTASKAPGSRRKRTISSTSAFASSMPATEPKSVPETRSALTSLFSLKPSWVRSRSRSQTQAPTSRKG